MACKVLSKEQMKAQIIEWLDSDAVIERVYYLIIGFLVAKNFSASVMRVYYLINGLKGIPL